VQCVPDGLGGFLRTGSSRDQVHKDGGIDRDHFLDFFGGGSPSSGGG
jgi:hypothetical protein